MHRIVEALRASELEKLNALSSVEALLDQLENFHRREWFETCAPAVVSQRPGSHGNRRAKQGTVETMISTRTVNRFARIEAHSAHGTPADACFHPWRTGEHA